MAGERRTRPETAGGLKRGGGHPRLEVEGGPDDRAPLVSLWCLKEKRETARAGPAGSRLGRCRPLARAGKRPLAWKPSRAKRKKKERKVGPAREKEERRGREGFPLFLNSF
jgi:hypothetical protein